VVNTTDDGMKRYPLRHFVKHSPDGFEWGYAGSGPSDLSLAILADYFQESPSSAELNAGYRELTKWEKETFGVQEQRALSRLSCVKHYHRFKWDFIMHFPPEGFTLEASIIKGWFLKKEREEAENGRKQ
jgi:hypothetical protein